MMETFLNSIQKTPLPTILILAGLLFILLGFVTKLGGIIEVSPEQKRWTIPTGLLVLAIGLVLNFATPTPNTTSTPTITPTTVTTPAPKATSVPSITSTNPETTISSGWQICNQSNEEKIYVAYNTKDDRGWVRKGWRTISQGQCSKILSTLNTDYVYYYAEGGNRKWPQGKGDKTFCVHPTDKFKLRPTESCDDPYITYPFKQVNTGDANSWTTTIK